MEFLLLRYDDHKGNLGRDSGLLSLFEKHHFACKAGYWGCPWYFINIESKCYYPGRPGLAYGKVIAAIDIQQFKSILREETFKQIGFKKVTKTHKTGYATVFAKKKK